jgi:spore germination protein
MYCKGMWQTLNNGMRLNFRLDDNLKTLNSFFTDCPDIIQKQVALKGMKRGCFIFIKEFMNSDLLQRDFLRPLMTMNHSMLSNKNIIDYLPTLNNSLCYDIDSVVISVLEGKIVFLIDEVNFAVACDLMNVQKRAISEPDGEKNVRGAHDGFIESLNTNISLLRTKIKSSKFKYKSIVLGNLTNQSLAIAYIEGIAKPQTVNNLYNKINNIKIDGLLSINYIEQLIVDSKPSVFPQYIATERIDKSVAALLEGKVAVLLDGVPYALIAPISFFSFFNAPDDYSSNWISGTMVRVVRFLSVITTLILPGLYISITAFQYYLIPTDILVQLGKSRATVAFPPAVEALMMEFTIQMIREASIRLPTYIGATIGVVGGIIIGQAAVSAGIVSNLFIIVVGIMAIAAYVTPNYDFGMAITVLRIFILLMASLFGIVGMITVFSLLLTHLLSLESLGEPYFSPIMPLKVKDIKDTIIRFPLKFIKKRPNTAQPMKKRRSGEGE